MEVNFYRDVCLRHFDSLPGKELRSHFISEDSLKHYECYKVGFFFYEGCIPSQLGLLGCIVSLESILY